MNQLTFVGIVGILDPPKPGVREAILALRTSSVEVKMLTGDSKETACAIGKNLNCIFFVAYSNRFVGKILALHSNDKVLLSGDEVDTMDERSFRTILPQVSIFYRVGPSHKLRIVKALQSLGFIVGMTGDGVNDGIALKKADIGIAMGRTGTDVCKEASDMILVNDDFFTIMFATFLTL